MRSGEPPSPSMIPTEIPERLRAAGIVPPLAGEYEAAWTLRDALQVISALEASNIAIEAAEGYKLLGYELVSTGDSWTFPPTSGETESSRARKSRAGASSFIQKLDPEAVDYVGLEFSYQDEAA